MDSSDALDDLETSAVTISRAVERTDASIWEVVEFVREREIEWVDENGLRSDLKEL